MRLFFSLLFTLAGSAAFADTVTVQAVPMTEWKAVYGQIEARNVVPARARIGGTVVELLVTEGDTVTAGEKIASVRDDKLNFQVAAFDAQLTAILAHAPNARGVLFETPHVAESAKTMIERAGLATRCSVVGGDFFRSVPAQGDLYLMRRVMHGWAIKTQSPSCGTAGEPLGKMGGF